MNELRIIISGGGTGGHIFPAVSIANALRELNPETKILFVGADGRLEMQRVPAAGYEIIGLPVRGLLRPLWKPGNISIMMDFLRSKRMVKQTLRDFKPHVAVGVAAMPALQHSMRLMSWASPASFRSRTALQA